VQRFDSLPNWRLTRVRESNMDTVSIARNSICAQLCCLLAVAGPAYPQVFGSGSKGIDGALILTTPGTILFEPRSFNPPLNQSADNIFHFTSIYIAKGVTVKLSAKFLQGSVFWLAQGPVVIDGTIDLDGADGGRVPAIAGAGGYPGGGVRNAGYGPGEMFKRNMFLVPLVGGSGGDGGEIQGGGAGGGALLIASSFSITVNGAITANGGASLDGVGGGGGAIRLVAPLVNGSDGVLSAAGGQPGGTNGRVRFETFDNRFTGGFNSTPFSEGKPFSLFLPPNPPASVRVIGIGDAPVTSAEFAIRQPVTLNVVVEARFIPPGASVQLECFLEDGPSQTVTTTSLLGTFELSRASASVAFPSGVSGCQAKADWKQPSRSEPPR
jgi:hypothetical protein